MSNAMLCRHGQVRSVMIMKIIRTSAASVVSSGGLSPGAYMTPHEVHLAQPTARPPDYHHALSSAQHRVIAAGQWTASQLMGRRWPIGCVALEITQRCNLDCSACYLSEHSEAVKDVPLEELFRRIDLIFEHYGPNTNVQVTGGDPTLRKREELVAIVRRLSQKGLRPALFTNGIRAKREWLVELVEAGLVDVAFHVDLTQERRGYESEVALNEIRQDYIERARGLPLSVMFNATIFDRNFEEIPAIVRFFVRNRDVVRLASFQLQAETGRGTLGRRNAAITVESVQEQIEKGARSSISFDALRVGHARCNRYGMIFVANNRAYDAAVELRPPWPVQGHSHFREGNSNQPVSFIQSCGLADLESVAGQSRPLGNPRSREQAVVRHPQLHGHVSLGTGSGRCVRFYGDDATRPHLDVPAQRQAGRLHPRTN